MKLLKNYLNKFIYLLNVIAAALLAVSYLASYISPEQFWPMAFFGLLYPILLVINIFFVLFWLVSFNKRILLSLLVILLGWNHLNNLIVLSSDSVATDKETFSIMSYNVKTFNAFPWAGWGEESRPKMIRLIDSIDTDIVCLQEFHTLGNIIGGKIWFNNINSILESGYEYHHYGETSSYREVSHFGL
ncbi:MAG: hypothetical protein JKX95_01245, partial [Bacteroidia bacterium]|nr:hypothetical protein [Bacteroidia bacterium]